MDFKASLPADVLAYLEAVEDKTKVFEGHTQKFADEAVSQQASLFVETMKDVVPRYLLLAQAFSAPAPNEIVIVFKVLAAKLHEISSIADKNKGEENYQILMAVKNAAEALNWVTAAPKPANCISDAYDGCLYYANRVSKDKGEDGKLWVKSLSQLLNAMKAYVIDYHQSGLLWKGATKCAANLREADISTLVEQLHLSGASPQSAKPANTSSGASAMGSASSPYLDEMKESLSVLSAKSRELGDLLEQQMSIFVDKVALTLIPHYLSLAEAHQAPPQSEYPAVFKDLVAAIGEITSLADSNPRHQQAALLNTAKTASEHFNWLAVGGRPQDFVKESLDSTMFYGNRAIKAGGDADKAWVQSLAQYFKKLIEVLKDFYPSGLVWKGKTPIGRFAGAAPVPPPPTGGLPPPPPPPAVMAASSGSNESAGDGRTQLFSELNKGTDITKGLKKVSKDMQTHKNPELRAGSQVPPVKSVAEKPSGATQAKPAAKVEKPPKMALEQDKKWVIENYKDETVTVEISNFKHTVYAFNCRNTTFVIKNKVNFISLDSCVKCGVVFDDLLSSVDIVNCKSVQIQALSKMPLLNIDKTDGVQVYLSADCLNCEIVTAKSSEMNILVPQSDGDFSEFPVPEQYKTVYDPKTNKLLTSCSESLG